MLAVVLLHLLVLGPLTHPALLPKLSAQHGPTMTYQTERIWRAKATPRLNKSPRLTRSFLHFHSSLMHQQNSVNQKIHDYALQMEKLQHVTMRSTLFNTSKLLREAASSCNPILTKKDPTGLSEWFERFKSHRMILVSFSLLRLCWYLPKKIIGHRSRSQGLTWLILDVFSACSWQPSVRSRTMWQIYRNLMYWVSWWCWVYVCRMPHNMVRGSIEVDEIANTDPFKGD